jgi:hypothetical protein
MIAKFYDRSDDILGTSLTPFEPFENMISKTLLKIVLE